MPIRLTPDVITAAIAGYSAQKVHIDAKIAELRAMLAGETTEVASTPDQPKRKKRRLSAKGRRAIAEGARKRWALIREAKEQASAAPPAKKAVRKKAASKKAAVKRAAVKKAPAKKAGKRKGATKKAAPAAAATPPASET